MARRRITAPETYSFRVRAKSAQEGRWQWGSHRLGCKNVEHFLAVSADFVCTRLERSEKRFWREEEHRAEQRRKAIQEEARQILANWPKPQLED